jgi:hypothetical protein
MCMRFKSWVLGVEWELAARGMKKGGPRKLPLWGY